MRRPGPGLVPIVFVLVAGVLAGLAAPATAQAPRHGGELVFVVGSEMPSYDGHREETFGLIHPIAPHYSTLLRTDPADPGFGKDIEANRREARRLLREAGVPDGFSFVFTNRNLPEPYEPATVWLLDQWRKIGLNVSQRVLESAAWFSALRAGDFEMSIAAWCGYIVEPDLDLAVYLSTDRTDGNYGRYTDRALDGLYDRQARARDTEERKRAVREFEKRLLDDQVHVVPLLWWHRIIPHSSRVRGWTITPSRYLNSQLDTVWRAPE